jgi:hypothetical protein
MRFEFTNQQYTDFLNSVATTDNCRDFRLTDVAGRLVPGILA